MKLTTTRKTENNKVETTIIFKEWGRNSISAEDEQRLLNDYPQIINYKDLTFSGFFKVENKEVVKATSTEDGEKVTLVTIPKLVPLTDAFQVKYEIGLNQILDSEIGTKLNTKELVAQAKCKLFEDTIKNEITKMLNALELKDNTFETSTPIEEIL